VAWKVAVDTRTQLEWLLVACVKRLCDKLWQLAPSRTPWGRQRFQFWRTIRTGQRQNPKRVPVGVYCPALWAANSGSCCLRRRPMRLGLSWWNALCCQQSISNWRGCQCTRSSLVILTNTHGYLYLLMIACTYFWSLAATYL
jgi:hypothetical protein